MSETTEVQAERFNFVSLEDALMVFYSVLGIAEKIRDNAERALENAARVFGTESYETAMAHFEDGTRTLHRMRRLTENLDAYIEHKWGPRSNFEHPFASALSQQGSPAQSLLEALFGDTPGVTPFAGGVLVGPFGMGGEDDPRLGDVADDNDPDAPVHGPEDEDGGDIPDSLLDRHNR